MKKKMLEGQRDKGWKVDCGQTVEQIKFGLYSVKEIWIVQREGVARWNWYPGSADLISGQIWKRGLERETTIGGPISVFQAAIYHKQVVGILVLRMKLREIVHVLNPHPSTPNPTPSYSVSEPGTAQEVSFRLPVSVRIWETQDLLLQNSTQKCFLKSFYVLSAAFLPLHLISFLG